MPPGRNREIELRLILDNIPVPLLTRLEFLLVFADFIIILPEFLFCPGQLLVCCMQFLVLAEQILFRPFAVSNFPDRLNCTDNRALCITERGGDEPERGPFPIIEVGDSDLRDEVLLVPDQILVFYYGRRVIPEDKIDQEGTALTVKGECIFIVAFSRI